MKRTMTVIVSALFVFLPITGLAAYIIHLKDGREFITERYVEEGDQIKFKVYGGLIGIQKDLVRDIEETAADVPEKTVVRAEPKIPEAESEAKEKTEGVASKKATEGPAGGDEVDKTDDKAQKKETDQPAKMTEAERKKAEQEKAERMQALLDEKRQIMREMEEVTSAFKEAKKNNNEAEKQKWWLERGRLRARLSELQEAVKAANDGKLPDWWQEGL